jgi:MoaA/NifB/PqqE/SkfB family radical SAM enzyme
MMAAAGRRVLQVHPSRLCNLECDHCYTMSGPGRRGALAGEQLASAVRDAAALGYDYLAVSGGEPLLYPGLGALIEAGHAAGMAVGITTNGTLPLTHRLRLLLRSVDVVAISLDGVPASHDLRRGRSAFRRTNRTVVDAARGGVGWGAIFTLTRSNLHELEWVAQYAAAYGARFVQVHPLTLLGRAARGLTDDEPDEIELAAAMTVAHLIERRVGVPVLVDAVRADQMSVGECPGSPVGARSLADSVPVLTVMPDGRVLPLHHGIHPSLALGSITDDSLASLAERWIADGHRDRLEALRARCLSALSRPEAPYVLSWPDHLAAASHAEAHSLALQTA